jgi:hypothetical protein
MSSQNQNDGGHAAQGENPPNNELVQLPNGDVQFRGVIVQVQEDLTHMTTAQLEFMAERGVAGRTFDRETINLHVNQNPQGPLWEIAASLNNINNLQLHPLGNAPGAGLTLEQRAAFNTWREAYWRARAREELARRRFQVNGVFK